MVSDARSRPILLIRPTVRQITHESRLFLVVARLPGAARSQSTIGVQKWRPNFELVSMSAGNLLLLLFQLKQMRVLKFR